MILPKGALCSGVWIFFVMAAAIGQAGCAGGSLGANWLYDDEVRPTRGPGGFSVQWRKRITNEYEGPYVPLERAVPVLDPPRNRVFVGTSEGHFYALTGSGSRVYRYDAGGAISAPAAFDPQANELFLATEQGTVHKLVASHGQGVWRQEVGGPVQAAPLLDGELLFVVTDNDQLLALARDNGETLWRHIEPPVEGFGISGHAGVLRDGEHVITGFSDGMVAAFKREDGSLVWAQDLSLEVEAPVGGRPRFVDVDTTPLKLDGRLLVASFAGGLYALDPQDGSVLHRDGQYTGVTAITHAPPCLILSSADLGVVCLDHDDYRERWRTPVSRGAPSAVMADYGLVLLGESKGSFLALRLRDGRERSRLESGHGFSSPAAQAGGRAFVLSNGGTLFALQL